MVPRPSPRTLHSSAVACRSSIGTLTAHSRIPLQITIGTHKSFYVCTIRQFLAVLAEQRLGSREVVWSHVWGTIRYGDNTVQGHRGAKRPC